MNYPIALSRLKTLDICNCNYYCIYLFSIWLKAHRLNIWWTILDHQKVSLGIRVKWVLIHSYASLTVCVSFTRRPQNLIAQSQSGTGKTAAFVLAMLSHVDPSLNWPQVSFKALMFTFILTQGTFVFADNGQFWSDLGSLDWNVCIFKHNISELK